MRPMHTGICGHCGVPSIWAKDSVLDGDNTSLHKMIPMRGVFYETAEVGHLIEKMEESIGVSLAGIVFTAHKRAKKRFFQGTVKGFSGTLAKAVAPRLIYDQEGKVAPLFGVGLMELASYRRGGPLVVEARNAWNERLLAAEVAGAFEAVESGEVECDVEIEPAGGGVRFTASRADREREEYRGRFVPLTGTLMGTREYPRCHDCGAPVTFQAFRWDPGRGEITERDNGIRVVHLTVACIDSMLQEMIEELGEDMRELAVRVEADYVRKKVLSGAYDSVRGGFADAERDGADSGGAGPGTDGTDEGRVFYDQLSLIRRRCLGNPIYIKTEPEGLTVHVRNPANDQMLAGRALGTFEALRQVAGRVSAERGGGTLKIRVEVA